MQKIRSRLRMVFGTLVAMAGVMGGPVPGGDVPIGGSEARADEDECLCLEVDQWYVSQCGAEVYVMRCPMHGDTSEVRGCPFDDHPVIEDHRY